MKRANEPSDPTTDSAERPTTDSAERPAEPGCGQEKYLDPTLLTPKPEIRVRFLAPQPPQYGPIRAKVLHQFRHLDPNGEARDLAPEPPQYGPITLEQHEMVKALKARVQKTRPADSQSDSPKFSDPTAASSAAYARRDQMIREATVLHSLLL